MICVQYNGCKWKGGKLRLEKAKEHYLTRLKREWEQEAAAAAQEAAPKDNGEKQDKPKLDKAALDASKINIYFPKLRKVSSCLCCSTCLWNLCLSDFITSSQYIRYEL
jgi:hypothetical protein